MIQARHLDLHKEKKVLGKEERGFLASSSMGHWCHAQHQNAPTQCQIRTQSTVNCWL